MPLRESHALLVAQQVAVEVLRRGELKRALQQYLPCGGFEQVASADNFRDVRGGIVDNAGKLIARQVVFAPDKVVAKVDASGEGLRPGMEIHEVDDFVVGHAKTVVQR